MTSIAPATLNRSVIVDPIWASSCIDSRVSRCRRRPTSRAGMMNTGTSSSEITVTGQDRTSIVTRTRISETALDTTEASVEVSACCAPITSLFSRLTSEPVCARVKKAMGWACTCRNTCARRS